MPCLFPQEKILIKLVSYYSYFKVFSNRDSKGINEITSYVKSQK